MNQINLLQESLKTGFLDASISSEKEYRPELLTNEPKQGIKVLTTILNELELCDEFWFSVAFVTTGGIATLINTLIELEKKKVKGKILASQYLNFTQPEALSRIRQFKNIELKIATKGDFHSKGYLFKKGNLYDLIIGSSNLTQTALCTNKEWNLKISTTNKSELISNAVKEFKKEFENAVSVTDKFLTDYEHIWQKTKTLEKKILRKEEWRKELNAKPNMMQKKALMNIEELRSNGYKKALLISATGTGKTYLSAFDVQKFKPKKFLFLVHRRTIAEEAKKTFEILLGPEIKMGIYSGNTQEMEVDYIFSTIQTISKDYHLNKFDPKHFNYIVIDETHRAAASSYQRIMNHFTPDFLLGMTATPERTDGDDIFKMFDHNIAYEIRLHQALEEKMLSPFHYYGVSDLTINNEEVDEFTDFNNLTAEERVNRIIENAEKYGCDDGNVRGLIFCSRNEISVKLSEDFNRRGYKTKALTGGNSEEQRREAINQLESNSQDEKLDYIFTVDIFNEGIDIPKVNQIIMLRPTQSAIIFIQQLGRGLRKIKNKSYLTVIDFIGNYNNNYLVPIALYGDTTYNKDALRKLIASGSSLIPGVSTINFDKVSKDKIFSSIDSVNMQKKRDLTKDYNLLKFKLGRIPMMIDFIEHGTRDPELYANYSKSYFNFVNELEVDFNGLINRAQKKILEVFSNEINNYKRIEETLMLNKLIEKGVLEISDFKKSVLDKYNYTVSETTINSCINNLNFEFVTENKNGSRKSIKEIYGFKIVTKENDKIFLESEFRFNLKNNVFKNFLIDNIIYAIQKYDKHYKFENFISGFSLYQKYSRKDVFRILNWQQNPLAQNVGGYMISTDKSNCPIFVNYHKDDDISSTTKYEDGFISPSVFEWMSKSRRTLSSNDVQTIRSHKLGLRLPLFIKKSNDEGTEFYFMGDVVPIDDSFEETKMKDDNGIDVSVVKINFLLKTPVENSIYNYIIKTIN